MEVNKPLLPRAEAKLLSKEWKDKSYLKWPKGQEALN